MPDLDLTPEQLCKRAAAHFSWANTIDRTARTAPAVAASIAARAARKQRSTETPPSPAEPDQRAEHLRKAEMYRQAFHSSKARADSGGSDVAS